MIVDDGRWSLKKDGKVLFIINVSCCTPDWIVWPQATLWLSEEYPLSFQEQIMPIVDLMAISNSHFAKLKDFIQMQLPSGFPVKIGKMKQK